MTVGTQAAVLAGLDMTMFVEFNPPPNSEWVGTVSGRCCVHSKVWCLIHLTTRIYAYLILLSRLLFAMQDPEMVGRCLKFLYYITITCAFCANLLVVANTTILSVLGAGMALRGPDGSMILVGIVSATEGTVSRNDVVKLTRDGHVDADFDIGVGRRDLGSTARYFARTLQSSA